MTLFEILLESRDHIYSQVMFKSRFRQEPCTVIKKVQQPQVFLVDLSPDKDSDEIQLVNAPSLFENVIDRSMNISLFYPSSQKQLGLFIMKFIFEKPLICHNPITQPPIACSKLTTETLEQGVKYVQSYYTLFQCFYC